ncbi:MAG: Type 1 glutamine amidotransferase-like domain-containing protein [Candidatus Nomurabacteria bacterium]|jgi:dipeptidase E|nr:Type 1 glutamine amidotransferase-like domain-containing protein [Candidatus Nomurabacteria bacterium]
MRLFLASKGFGDHLERLHDMVGVNKMALLIFNATDEKNALTRVWKKWRKKQMFKNAGFDVLELDLKVFFGRRYDLEMYIKSVNPGLIYAFGGNVFILRRAFRYSSFDDVLASDLASDKYVYGGGSAGSVIMSKELKYFVNKEDMPEVVPKKKYQADTIWQGMGLIDEYLLPHADAKWFDDSASEIRLAFNQANIKPVVMTDADVFVVDGERRGLEPSA